MSVEERRREMDLRMATVMANHQTILSNQDYVIEQLTHQHNCIEALKREVSEMKEIVREVGELLTALKGLSLMARWATALVGFAYVIYQWGNSVTRFIFREWGK